MQSQQRSAARRRQRYAERRRRMRCSMIHRVDMDARRRAGVRCGLRDLRRRARMRADRRARRRRAGGGGRRRRARGYIDSPRMAARDDESLGRERRGAMRTSMDISGTGPK